MFTEVLLFVQWILLSVAIAIIIWQWVYYKPSAVSKKNEQLNRCLDYMVEVDAFLRQRLLDVETPIPTEVDKSKTPV